jgi:hypothetical protein
MYLQLLFIYISTTVYTILNHLLIFTFPLTTLISTVFLSPGVTGFLYTYTKILIIASISGSTHWLHRPMKNTHSKVVSGSLHRDRPSPSSLDPPRFSLESRIQTIALPTSHISATDIHPFPGQHSSLSPHVRCRRLMKNSFYWPVTSGVYDITFVT